MKRIEKIIPYLKDLVLLGCLAFIAFGSNQDQSIVIDDTASEILMEENRELKAKVTDIILEIEILHDEIAQDSILVWSADRVTRDSLRTALNPR